MISVQHEDFVLQQEYDSLVEKNTSGAIVTFVGRVRDFANSDEPFLLEHYPGMTENVLTKIEQDAHRRWDLINTKIIHRVGKLEVDEQIVFVGVSSAHRDAAFSACHYMIDILKTQAPFWKKEGPSWVDAKESDQLAAQTWLKK